MFIKHHNL